MTENKRVSEPGRDRFGVGGEGLEEKGRNSAEVDTTNPGPSYNPPPMSVDSQPESDNGS